MRIAGMVALVGLGCTPAAAPPQPAPSDTAIVAAPSVPVERCGGAPMTVRFYDVGQALSALVELPDGRRILVDAGEAPDRAGCGEPCRVASRHLLEQLAADVPDKRIDALWITHQHSDHAGNAATILRAFTLRLYIDNGTRLGEALVVRARDAARERQTEIAVVDPEHAATPLANSAAVTLTPIVPKAWPTNCDTHPNDCSIGLRIDYCSSSVLFVGDAEAREEAALDPRSPVTVLQVGHHGSETSSSDAFVQRVRPRWAVISAGKPGEAMNRQYCHPRRATVERLSALVGGDTKRPLETFQGTSCQNPQPGDWTTIDASDRVLVTARDGDIVLTTTGDGAFSRR